MPPTSAMIDLDAMRAKQARLARSIGKTGFQLLTLVGVLLLISGLAVFIGTKSHLGISLVGLSLMSLLPALWWKRQLSVLPPDDTSFVGRLSRDTLATLKKGQPETPSALWKALSQHWQANFFLNHLQVHPELVGSMLSNNPAEAKQALGIAEQLADQNQTKTIELGFAIAGLLLTSAAMRQTLVKLKLQPEDVVSLANWLARAVDEEAASRKRNYGGIGRDWAFGFTPLLNRFGHNVSQSIITHGAHFDWLSESNSVKAIETAFNNHAKAVALIGPDGIGKTTNVYALAQRLIEGRTAKALAYHQIIDINATDITSAAHAPGDLEQIMLSLTHEASLAGHVILFFDDAQLFFSDQPGAFDASQILLSIIQNSGTPIILAMSPSDFQRLRNRSQSLASQMTPVILQEPTQSEVMRILEDVSLGVEHQHKILVTYSALHETYRLSGRYEQDEAYPGKAIKLLQQAVSHSVGEVLTAESVQKAIEQTRGVKAGSAAPAEAEKLLNLENEIHERMINQSQAVSVVANALRRARAGVTNPRRPIGSFLFLGPTGVGKTELAKAIAATYFGAESAMIRLDMSEYQQPEDVQRLLSTGQSDNASLLLSVRQQPFAVVLFDEIEKAHPNVLNLLLQLLDEGQLTDMSGRSASFKDCVIIATSNAGAQTIRERIAAGQAIESFQSELTDQLISAGQFKPELLNRFDDMVLFRPLNPDELAQVVRLMLAEVNQTLTTQNISIDLTDAAISLIVEHGNDPRLGARPMRRALQKAVEDTVARKILSGQAQPGDVIVLDVGDLSGQSNQAPQPPSPSVSPQ